MIITTSRKPLAGILSGSRLLVIHFLSQNSLRFLVFPFSFVTIRSLHNPCHHVKREVHHHRASCSRLPYSRIPREHRPAGRCPTTPCQAIYPQAPGSARSSRRHYFHCRSWSGTAEGDPFFDLISGLIRSNLGRRSYTSRCGTSCWNKLLASISVVSGWPTAPV